MIEKLILISPVGVERSQYSLLKRETNLTPQVSPEQELLVNQEDIVHGNEIEQDPRTRTRRLLGTCGYIITRRLQSLEMPVLSNLNSYPGGQHIDFPTSTTRMSNNLKYP